MSDYTIANLHEYNQLVEQFFDLAKKIENFEFKFYADSNPNTILVAKKDTSLSQLSQG